MMGHFKIYDVSLEEYVSTAPFVFETSALDFIQGEFSSTYWENLELHRIINNKGEQTAIEVFSIKEEKISRPTI